MSVSRTYRRWCSVRSCKNNTTLTEGYSFFLYPKNDKLALEWLKICKREDLLERGINWRANTYVCGKHFENRMFLNFTKNRLKPHAIPTLFLYDPIKPLTAIKLVDASPSKSNIVETGETVPTQTTDVPSTSTELPVNLADMVSEGHIAREMEEMEQQIEIPAASIEIDANCSRGIQVQPSTSFGSTQCEKALSATSPRKTKLRNTLKAKRKKLQLLQKTEQSHSIEYFLSLCDKFLTPELSNVVKFTAKTKNSEVASYPAELKQFALNIHFLSPKVYKYLSRIMKLPNTRTLRRWTQHWNISPGISTSVFAAIELKISQFNEEARECILCMDEMSLKSNLFYNITADEIVGFHKVNGSSSSLPANSSLVLFAKGIHINWKQPVGYVFTHSVCTHDELHSFYM